MAPRRAETRAQTSNGLNDEWLGREKKALICAVKVLEWVAVIVIVIVVIGWKLVQELINIETVVSSVGMHINYAKAIMREICPHVLALAVDRTALEALIQHGGCREKVKSDTQMTHHTLLISSHQCCREKFKSETQMTHHTLLISSHQ